MQSFYIVSVIHISCPYAVGSNSLWAIVYFLSFFFFLYWDRTELNPRPLIIYFQMQHAKLFIYTKGEKIGTWVSTTTKTHSN